MTLDLLLDEIRTNVSRILLSELRVSGVDFSVGPAKPGFGDATCNVSFLVSKRLKKTPREIAETIAQKYPADAGRYVSRAVAHPSGYVNFDADMGALGRKIIKGSVAPGYGSVDIGRRSRMVVEHTSVNPNKALHIGHVRNIVIGDTVSRILRKANYDVTVLNYVDDSGLQVADIVLGFQKLGFPEEPPANTKFDHYCGDEVYVGTTQRYAERPELEQARRDILKEIEEGTSETARFAGLVTRRVLAGQLQTCWNLSVTYDCLNYESQIIRSGLWAAVFEKLKEMGLIEFEDTGRNAGCWVIRGGDGGGKEEEGEEEEEEKEGEGEEEEEEGEEGAKKWEKDKVIVRSNGTATYIAKDIPYAAWKLGLIGDPFSYERYGSKQPGSKPLWSTTLADTGIRKDFRGGRAVTVIDSRQSRLQRIITDLMDGFASSAGAYTHLGYESVTLSPGTAQALGMQTTGGKQAQMSGRKGLYINADSVYDMLVEKAAAETRRRNPDLGDDKVSEIARAISVGTLRYEMIKQDLDKVISFDLDKSLSLEGDTSPYIQYTHARASRIIEKSPAAAPDFDARYELLESEYEKDLIKRIGLLGGAVGDAARNFSPKVIARYCHDLAVAFNSFYEHVKVLDSDDSDLINARVCLVSSFRATLDNALSLLGIAAPSRM